MTPNEPAPQHPLLHLGDDAPAPSDALVREFFILRQEVDIEVNFCDRQIDGFVDIYLVSLNDRVDEIVLDAADCEIDVENILLAELREEMGELLPGQPRKAHASYRDPYERLAHPASWNWTAKHHDLRRMRANALFRHRKTDIPAENREFEGCTPAYGSVKVSLRGKGEQDRPKLIIRKSSLSQTTERSLKQYKISVPFCKRSLRDGLHFVGVDSLDNRYAHMYTRHSLQPGTASCIFPCVDDHGVRCDWKISLRFPRTLGDALGQALVTQKDTSIHQDPNDVSTNGSIRAIRLAEEDKLREMSVICSGFLMEDKVDPRDDRKRVMVFEPEKKVSVQQIGFAVGPFEHIDLSSEFRTEEDELKLGMSALKIHAYHLPHRGSWVRATAAALTIGADFLTYTFAKYPFGSLKVCFLDDMVQDTVALHSMSFVSNRLLFPAEVIDTEIDVTRQILFNLTYQWIGINVIPNTRNDIWLVLGIAHYMTDLFMKKLCGNNEHRFRMKTMSDQLVQADVGRPSLWALGPKLHLSDSELEFMTLKASVVLFILDKRLAKASGGHGLMRILAKFLTKAQIESSDKPTILDTEKFRLTCEKGSRSRLESFWDQWIYGSGCPRFDVKAKFNKKRLCVELMLTHIQNQLLTRPEIHKNDFLRLIREKREEFDSEEVQQLFTGPMTIRIHEADGTPYEHILEIREDASRLTKFEIPYNTKYKRLKRTRRMKEKLNPQLGTDAMENTDDTLLYCLGDVLQSPEDQKVWELKDWDQETERKMDQESYEWIRIDADFEWACDMKHTLEPYMYVSQLQQDRDVVAQQDAILYLSHGPLHPIAAAFLVRTLVDRRYYHGIRSMAARALPRQANIKGYPMLGLRQLLRAYRQMFCYDQTNQPYPNDFSDKKQYIVRCAIIKAIAEVRDHTHKCPFEARRFILDQLLFNNNEENPYSDHLWIAHMVEALATSLIPSEREDWFSRRSRVPSEEERGFLQEALEQIERILRRDEWTNSHGNVWTIAGLEAKRRLMEAGVIPTRFADFGQYLLDGTRDLIRIKAFEALVDLGALMDPNFFAFLLYSLTSDRSPYVRKRLILAVARGLAALALGEHVHAAEVEQQLEELDNVLLVQDSAHEIEARKKNFARRESLSAALAALRKDMDEIYARNERHYSTAFRKALDHPNLGREELEDLLDLAAMMFEEASSWVLTLNLPKGWRVERPTQRQADRLLLSFKSFYKTKPKTTTAVASGSEAKRTVPAPRATSIKISAKVAASQNRIETPFDGREATRTPVSAPHLSNGTAASLSPDALVASAAKRVRIDGEGVGTPAPKRPKVDILPSTFVDPSTSRKGRIVTLKTQHPKRLAVLLGVTLGGASNRRTALPQSSPRDSSTNNDRNAITAKPPRKPLPNGDHFRKPLPNGGNGGGHEASRQATSSQSKGTVGNTTTPARDLKTGDNSASTPAGSRPQIKIARKALPETPRPPSPPS